MVDESSVITALKTPEFAKALAEGRINVEYSNDEDGVTTLNITANETEERVVFKDGPGPERIVMKEIEVPGPERVVYRDKFVPGPERIVYRRSFRTWFWGFVKGVFITLLLIRFHMEIGNFITSIGK